MENGIELDIFIVKDKIRYKVKTISINEVSKILANSLMDGVDKIINPDEDLTKEGV